MTRVVPDHLRCTATAKGTGERCGLPKLRGAPTCWKHGSGAPQVRAKAKRRLEAERHDGEVARLIGELGFADGADPVEVLAEAVTHTASMVRVLRHLVGRLEPTFDAEAVDAVDAAGRRKASLYGPDHLGDARPHVLVSLLGEWTDRAARTSKLAIEAGLEERQVRIAEAVGERLAEAVGAIVNGMLGELRVAGVAPSVIDAFERDQVPVIVRRELLAIAATSTEVSP